MIENLLRKRFRDKYEFFSAGISPISLPSMDSRSLEFLLENNVGHNFHTPKRVNNKMLNYFDKFLAVDPYVLNKLNITYPKYKHKFCSITSQFNDISIVDPYHLEPEKYARVMTDIRHVVENIDLEKLSQQVDN